MKHAEPLEALMHALPAGANEPVGTLLRRVAHDLRTPCSTLGMELFSIRALVKELGRAHDGPELEELDAICANLDATVERLSAYADMLGTLAPESAGKERRSA